MNLNPELLKAYSEAKYVICCDPKITLTVDKFSYELLSLMREKGFRSAAFITAFNPFSKILSADKNELRHKSLVEEVRRLELDKYEGFGSDQYGNWPVEKSLLVLDLEKPRAIKLAIDFGQNAILWIEQDAIPRLVITI